MVARGAFFGIFPDFGDSPLVALLFSRTRSYGNLFLNVTLNIFFEIKK